MLLCQDPDAAGQEAVAKGTDAIRAFNAARAGDRLEVRVVRLPPGRDPADVVARRTGPRRCRRCSTRSVPVARFSVDRALAAHDLETPEGRDRALQVVAPIIGRVGPGLLQDDLIRLAADRLQMTEAVTYEALRRAGRREAGRNGAPARAGPPRMVTSVDLREDTERAFLARCLAVKEAGPRRARGDGRRRDVRQRPHAAGGALPRRAPRAPRARSCPPARTTSPGWSPSWSSAPASWPPTRGRSSWSASSSTRCGSTAASPTRAAPASRSRRSAVERQRVQDEIRHRLV